MLLRFLLLIFQFAVRKEIQRAAKKAKTFGVRKIIQRIKEAHEDATKKKLEDQLKKTRTLDLTTVAQYLFVEQVVKKNEYLGSKISVSGEWKEDLMSVISLILGNSLRKSLDEISFGLVAFVKKLYHEEPKNAEGTGNKKVGLKEQEDVDYSSKDIIASNKTAAVIKHRVKRHEFRNGNTAERKNRKGQRARRAEWEKKYGSQARHLQSNASCSNLASDIRDNHHTRKSSPEVKLPKKKDKVKDGQKESGKLHPSWEARKQQAALRRALIAQPAQHKKITFSTNDDE